jgi:hypothetical protein
VLSVADGEVVVEGTRSAETFYRATMIFVAQMTPAVPPMAR